MMWRTSPPARAGDRVGLAAQAERVAVVAPLRLDDLELARDRGLQADEEQPARRAVVRGAVGQRRAVGHPAAQDPVARGEPALPAERVARVRAPHVGAARAAQPERVVAVAEVVGALACRCRAPGRGRRGAAPAGCRRASARPAWPRRAPRRAAGARACSASWARKPATSWWSLRHTMKLALRSKGAGGAGARAAVLVLVAQDELARLDRAPARAAQRPPRHALVGDPLAADVLAGDALDGRLREAVGEAEVLALLAEQPGRLRVGELEPAALGAQLALPAPAPRPRAPRRSGRARRRGPRGRAARRSQVPGSSPRRSARAAMPSRTSCGEAVEDPRRQLERRERAEARARR